jgi:DNA-binding NtrC family response regulator
VPTLGVEVIEGPDAGASVTVDREMLSVGTATGNDLVLSDETVSRYHLELVRLERGVRVLDLGSTNGTIVAGVQIERGVVQPGSVLEVGASKLKLRGGDQALIELHSTDSVGALRGRTPTMRRLMARLMKVASTEVAVLLVGESGTGKELIARAIHDHSPRSAGPFVTVDCGALSPNLVASELFGHERGAFTGADRERLGAFELASGGTLFLDEVGELPQDLQTYLLGGLERRIVKRVGGTADIAVDVRVVSATNRDLRAEVNSGNFRLDLYYRMAVTTLEVPPLRDRIDDIALLIEHFLRQLDPGASLEQVAPPDVMRRLRSYAWPGNVRELKNVVEASLAMGETLQLNEEDRVMRSGANRPVLSEAALEHLSALPYRDARAELIEAFERRYLEQLLDRAGGNVSQAARDAQMNRSHLSELVQRHKLR